MLINKLIQSIVAPSLKFKNLYFLAADKAQKPKQPAKSAAKKDKKGKADNKAVGDSKAGTDPKKDDKANQPPPSYLTSTTQAGLFYRRTIQKVHVIQRTGRGTFNEQALLQIISTATAKDITLLFQSYYNYLGHFTLISNKTVDALLVKAVNLGSKSEELVQQTCKKVFELYKNHQYLGYFPHYQTTLRIAEFAAKANKFSQFIEILKSKLLIKLDGKTIKGIFEQATNWEDFIKFAKIVSFKFNKGLLVDASKQQILNQITAGIKTKDNIKPTPTSREYTAFLSNFQKQNLDLALAWIIIQGRSKRAAQMLKKVDLNDPNIKVFTQTVLKLQQGKTSADIRAQLQSQLQNTPHAQLFK